MINFKHLNRFLWKQHFKYEDLRVAMLLFERDNFMFSFDLKSGYHHVDISKTHTNTWVFPGEGSTMSSLSSHSAWPQPVTYSLSCSEPLFTIGVH